MRSGCVVLSAVTLAACAAPMAAAAPSQPPRVPAAAPWLFGAQGASPIQTAPRLPALRFPAGTTYRVALTRLVRAVAADGRLPAGAVVTGRLPRGVVWAPSPSGPRLDLTAPASYSLPRGVILTPTITFPASVPPRQAIEIVRRLNAGGHIGAAARTLGVGVPRLAACQLLPRKGPCALVAVSSARA